MITLQKRRLLSVNNTENYIVESGNKIYFPYSALPQDMRKEDEGK